MSRYTDYDLVNQNIGAPSWCETGLLAFQISDKILDYLKKNDLIDKRVSLGLGGIILEECEQIRQVGVNEGMARAKCDGVCRALFQLD